MNNFDKWGWYTRDENEREATVPPPIASETTIPGEDRANWTGHEWVVVPYTQPRDTVCLRQPVPEVITPRQGRIVLSQYGLLSAVDGYFAALTGDGAEIAKIEWEYAQEWRRDWPVLVAATTSFGLTTEQIDQMFIAAVAL